MKDVIVKYDYKCHISFNLGFFIILFLTLINLPPNISTTFYVQMIYANY